MFLFERNTAFVLQGSPSGRLPRFARNDIKCVARKRIKKVRKFCNKFPSNKLLYSVRSTMSLRGAKRRGNLPEGIPCYKPTQDTEKGAHKQKSEHYLPDNAISKVQLSGTPRDTVYSRGKGAHKQKTNNCRLRRLFGQKCSVRRGARQYHRGCGGIVF